MINEDFKTTIIPAILNKTCEEFKVKWGFATQIDDHPEENPLINYEIC